MLLGCDGGHVFKYEKQFNIDQWKWAGKLKLAFKVWDILQTSLNQVLVCQDSGEWGGIFDFVDVETMVGVSHIRIQELSVVNMVRMTYVRDLFAVAD